jgi:hypothetical protein
MAITGISMLAREVSDKKTGAGEAKADRNSVPWTSTHGTGSNDSALHAKDKDIAKEWA